MKRAHTPLVIGNWKMNPGTAAAAKRLHADVKKGIVRMRGVDVMVAPPTIFLTMLTGRGDGSRPGLAAQNVHWDGLGAHTGETSVVMLKNVGVSAVIVGHSERRAAGETDAEVNKKVAAVLKAGLVAVMCVGERTRDQAGNYLNVVEGQIRAGLAGVTKAKLGHVVIAYEPVWAIGTGNTATADDVHEMKLFIQKTLADLYGRNMAAKTRILYGGSVNSGNAEELLSHGMVNGFLVGGASLRGSDFVDIVKIADRHDG